MAKNKGKKRNSRSKVLIDVDDFMILYHLSKFNYNIKALMEKLNISYNGLQTHLKRLMALHLIAGFKSPERDYKSNFFMITKKGRHILPLLAVDPNKRPILSIRDEKGRIRDFP